MLKIPFTRGGVDVSGAQTAQEAITAAGLDWKVEKRPVHFPISTGGLKPLAESFVTVRTDTEDGLGVVGSRYVPFQNKTVFSFFDQLVAEKGANYTKAGQIDGGARVYLLAKLPKTVQVAGVDAVDTYLIFNNSHDGSSSIEVKLLAVRLICSNGLTGWTDTGSFKVRHTSTIALKLAQAREILHLSAQSIDQFLEKADALARTKLNKEIVEQFLQGIDLHKLPDESTRRENQRFDVLRLIERGIGHQQAEIKNSLWSAVNAVTEYVDHKEGDTEKRLSSIWFGHGAQLKEKAFKTALSLAR